MPWKGEKDPYKIWLSEIILQQTRVEQGLNYYENFIISFPDIHQLANAENNQVFKLWEGLGYYTRCRNLLATARYISAELQGNFPSTYDEILKLKGVGTYTAAAISSFAYNLPHAVVDGNVVRVIARIFGINKPFDTTDGKKFFAAFAEKLLDKNQPGIYNQAIMDFGAVICKPVTPLCAVCIFQKTCFAFQHNKTGVLPVKAKKITIRNRWFNYLVLTHRNEVLIHERTASDIWRHLFEFILIESKKEENSATILKAALKNKTLELNSYTIKSCSPVLKQQLSHQLIRGLVIELQLPDKIFMSGSHYWVKKTELEKYPFPKFINQYLDQLFN